MGAKYLPTIKDQRLGQRYQQKQHVQSKFIKPSGKPAPKRKLTWRPATEADLPLLATWNHQLIQDEAHRNAMTVPQLEARLRGWLQTGEYQAVVFSHKEPVAHAVFKRDAAHVHVRQFFVRRDLRRTGIGRAAVALLRKDVWPAGVRLTAEVLCHNPAGVAFWRSLGYRDYGLTLELLPA